MENPEEVKNEETQEKSVLEIAMEKIDNNEALSSSEYEAILNADDDVLNGLEKKDKGKDMQDPDSNTEDQASTEQPKEEVDLSEKYRKAVAELEQTPATVTKPEPSLEEKLKDPKFAKQYLAENGVIEDDEDDDTDYLDPNYLKGVKKSLNMIKKLEGKVNELEGKLTSKERAQAAESAKDRNVRQIEEICNEYPGLKLSKGFEKTHEDYKNWFTVIGKENAAKYTSDENFRAEMDKKGYKMPFSMDEYSRLSDIYTVFNKYQKDGLKSVRDAFRASSVFDKFLNKGQAIQDGEALVDEKLKEIEKQVKTLDNNSTQTTFETEVQMSEQDAIALLDKDPNTLGERDKKRYYELVNTLTARN